MTNTAHVKVLYLVLAAVSGIVVYDCGRLSTLQDSVRKIKQPLMVTVNPAVIVKNVEYTNHLPGWKGLGKGTNTEVKFKDLGK